MSAGGAVCWRCCLLAVLSAGGSGLAGDTLVLSEPAGGELVIPVLLAPDGLVLMPSVFNWPDVSGSRSTSTQSTLV
jgi:hypothetical protein